MLKKNKSEDVLKYAKDIARLVKNERFLKKSSGIQKSCQKAFLLLVDVAEEMCNNELYNEDFGNFLIEQAKILKEIGKKCNE